HRGRAFSVAYRPDGNVLATVAWVTGPTKSLIGSEVCLWDPASGRPRRAPVALPRMAARCLARSPDGNTGAVGGDLPGRQGVAAVGGVVVLIDADRGRQRGTSMLHAEAVTAVAFHPGGEQLATASQDGVARFWDARTQVRRQAVLRHPYPLASLTFCREGTVLATAGGQRLSTILGQGEVRIWDVATCQELVQPLVRYDPGWTADVHALAFSPD